METTADLQRLVAEMCGEYCPLLRVGYVIAVARLEYVNRGKRTLLEVETAVRTTLAEAVLAITSFA